MNADTTEAPPAAMPRCQSVSGCAWAAGWPGLLMAALQGSLEARMFEASSTDHLPLPSAWD